MHGTKITHKDSEGTVLNDNDIILSSRTYSPIEYKYYKGRVYYSKLFHADYSFEYFINTLRPNCVKKGP